MTVVATAGIVIGALIVWTAVINGAFARCPYCGKIGAWRFDDLEEPVLEQEDPEIELDTKSTTRQRCRKCGSVVIHIVGDHFGREIRKVD